MKAFPQAGLLDSQVGMDLRDYFAAKFIPEICKHSQLQGWNYEENAKICYAMADAMMKAREK
jgi:hypothetical protein